MNRKYKYVILTGLLFCGLILLPGTGYGLDDAIEELKAVIPQQKEIERPKLLGVDFSYGVYQGTVTNTNAGGSFTSAFDALQPNLGVGLNLNLPLYGMPKDYCWDFGYKYNFSNDGLMISYWHLDVLGVNEEFYGGMGINYSFWNKGIAGGIGYQFNAGKPINDRIMMGIRYTSFSGNKNAGAYDNSYNIAQTAIECKINLR